MQEQTEWKRDHSDRHCAKTGGYGGQFHPQGQFLWRLILRKCHLPAGALPCHRKVLSMVLLTPRYCKQAKLLLKGLDRFVNFKRDLLSAGQLEHIASQRSALITAIKQRRRPEVESLSQSLNDYCGGALPGQAQGVLAENVEMLWVALVIVLGIRAFLVQPFQIPTGSMQPTLNGITAEATTSDPSPGFLGHLASWFTGTRYIHAVSDHTGYLDDRQPITEHRFLIFMPYCKLHFRDGHSLRINAPQRQLLDELQLVKRIHSQPVEAGNDTPDRRMVYGLRGGEHIRKGQLLASGIVRNGDHVLVDKFSYHFRRPVRGEVFVFTTKHIAGIQVPEEQGAQYYIKRLTGLPGDLLEVDSPKLLINGKPAAEPGISRVASGERDKPVAGYRGYGFAEMIGGNINKIHLRPGDYFAMGDNSYNSSDSRAWGPVPERNLVGPGLACYWPLTRHFGWIR